ncbi:MAG: radical SAM protein [Desulfobacter sp.]
MKQDIDMLMVYPRPTKDSPVCLVPLSILFPGALFKSQGKKVAYFDQRFDPEEMLDELILRSKEIGVSTMTGYQTGKAADILMRAKQLRPDIITGVGGTHVLAVGKQVLQEPFVDKIWENPVYGEDLFPFDEQTRIHFERCDMQYMTSRGCPFACRFCSLTSPWEPYDLERIDRELSTIHKAVGFDYLSLSDPNIGHYLYKDQNGCRVKVDNVKRMYELGEILRRLNVKWESNIRAPLLRGEMIRALEWAGCTEIEIGCESGSERMLRKVVRKGHGVEAIKQTVREISHTSISTMYSFIAFMPGEEPSDLNQTMDLIDWISENDPKARISVYHYAPYPGTPMFDDAVQGKYGFPKFKVPQTMKEWGDLKLMASPIYWIAGLNFRMDNTRKNFPGDDWQRIAPYVDLAREKWAKRDILSFPCEEVETLIKQQLRKQEQKRLAAS